LNIIFFQLSYNDSEDWMMYDNWTFFPYALPTGF
jgi:hypothetical protein